MSVILIALIAGIAAYLLFPKPAKPKSAGPLPRSVRVLLGVVLVIVSGIAAFIVGFVLTVSLDLWHSVGPGDVVVGSIAFLLVVSALSLATGYRGARLIVMEKDDSLPKRTEEDGQPILMPLDGPPQATASTVDVPAHAHERAPVDVDRIREIRDTAQVEGEPPRRWFFSHEQDLLVWFGPDGRPSAFQLAYGKYRNEHALRWKADRGFAHYVVDDGERGGAGSKQAALLEPDGVFPASKVLKRFLELSKEVPGEIVEFVSQRLQEHPEYRQDT